MGKVKLILCIIILISGCDREESNQNDLSQIYTQWKLVYFSSQDAHGNVSPVTFTDDDTYSIHFKDDGSITATDACNSCVGQFTQREDDQISVSSFYCTEIACNEPQYLFFLRNSYSATIESNTLELNALDSDWNEQYIFEKE